MEKLSFLKNVTSRVYALSSDSAMKTMIKDYWLIEKVNTNSEIFFLKMLHLECMPAHLTLR